MIGTPAYMAPEQFTGKGIDHRADLFACGVLLYRMLTGRRAFTGATQEVMYKILNERAAGAQRGHQGPAAGGVRRDRGARHGQEPGRPLPRRAGDARGAAGALARAGARRRPRPR